MTSRKTSIAMLLSLLVPLAAAAQNADKPAAPATEAKPEAAPAAPAAAQPAEAAAPAKPAAPAEPPAAPKPPAVTFEFGGWLILNSWWDSGALNASDLPRSAGADKEDTAAGFSVRQSRLRFGVNVPSGGGLLGNPALRGFVEADFAGGFVNGDESAPLPRLRHAYVSATWKEKGNLTLLVGQTTDIFHGSVGAVSLAHLAVPRFGGAGYLYRRAPQVRLSGELGKDVAIGWTVGAITAYDKFNQPTATGTSVGYRAGVPNAEARLAFLLRGASKVKVELGVGARYGQEKYLLADGSNETVESRGAAADLKVEAGWLTLVGGAFAGENLDVENSIAPGVATTQLAPPLPNPAPASLLTSVKSVPTKGGWAQLQLTPVKTLQLLAGAGVELPDEDLLLSATAIKQNLQISGGAIVNLTSKWRAGVEYTRYETKTMDDQTARSSQLEVSTLLAF